ncbi:MAG: antitoxin [Dermatophilaceae bacterium]
MRTTVTLDPDTEAIVRGLMQAKGLSFKQALNDAIRAGAAPRGRAKTALTRPRTMGSPSVNLDKALVLAAELEDDELIRRMRLGR